MNKRCMLTVSLSLKLQVWGQTKGRAHIVLALVPLNSHSPSLTLCLTASQETGLGDPCRRAAPGEAVGFLSLPGPTVQGCSR